LKKIQSLSHKDNKKEEPKEEVNNKKKNLSSFLAADLVAIFQVISFC
jgi:hypothetical protein